MGGRKNVRARVLLICFDSLTLTAVKNWRENFFCCFFEFSENFAMKNKKLCTRTVNNCHKCAQTVKTVKKIFFFFCCFFPLFCNLQRFLEFSTQFHTLSHLSTCPPVHRSNNSTQKTSTNTHKCLLIFPARLLPQNLHTNWRPPINRIVVRLLGHQKFQRKKNNQKPTKKKKNFSFHFFSFFFFGVFLLRGFFRAVLLGNSGNLGAHKRT